MNSEKVSFERRKEHGKGEKFANNAQHVLEDDNCYIFKDGYPVHHYQPEVMTLDEYYDLMEVLVGRFDKRLFENAESGIHSPAESATENKQRFEKSNKKLKYAEVNNTHTPTQLAGVREANRRLGAFYAASLFSKQTQICQNLIKGERNYLKDHKKELKAEFDGKTIEERRQVVFSGFMDTENCKNLLKEMTEITSVYNQEYGTKDVADGILYENVSDDPASSVAEEGKPKRRTLREYILYDEKDSLAMRQPVDEFIGETLNIVIMGLEAFFDSRFEKIGKAMKSMDAVHRSIGDFVIDEMPENNSRTIMLQHMDFFVNGAKEITQMRKTENRFNELDAEFRSEKRMLSLSVEDMKAQQFASMTNVEAIKADKAANIIPALEKIVRNFIEYVQEVTDARVEFGGKAREMKRGVERLYEINARIQKSEIQR